MIAVGGCSPLKGVAHICQIYKGDVESQLFKYKLKRIHFVKQFPL